MTDQMKRAMNNMAFQLLRLGTPMLLLAVLYFVKPIFDAVPKLQMQAEVAAVQQQALVSTMADVSAKQEGLAVQINSLNTDVKIVGEKVSRLERKIDE